MAPTDGAAEKTGRWPVALKWIGGVSAVISLLLGLNQVTGLVQKFRIHHQEFSEAMTSGEQQMDRADYPAAFASFKHAVELDPVDRDAQARETHAATLWLETAHAANQTFTVTADQLLPVLDNALTRATGTDAADLLAHIGWANFLKYRDGQREGVTIDENYVKALGIDPANVYAHAMKGHWILFSGGTLQDAHAHFLAALATNKVKPYVRELQIAALRNRSSPETDAELLRVANDMRKDGESIADPGDRSSILWSNFETQVGDHDALVRSLSILPAADTEATYDWLAAGDHADVSQRWTRDFVVANLRELTGSRAEALAQYLSLQQQLRGKGSALSPYVDQSIKRVSSQK